MNKLIIFDLDGVLIDSREIHYHSLNQALVKVGEQYVINRDEHLSMYDGLSTTQKLNLLTKTKKLDAVYFDKIWQDKQEATFEIVKKLSKDNILCQLFSDIKKLGFKIAVASNSIRETVKLSLLSIGVMEYVDYYISNQDVSKPKPFPEMYWKCMTVLNCLPKNTIIVEDSHIGREAAANSEAVLFAIENYHDLKNTVVITKLKELMNKLSNQEKINVSWNDSNLNVLIPMAGAGSRFSQKGYTFPKPLVEVNGKPMIEVVVKNLNINANYIFLVQKEHYEKYNLKYLLNLIAPNCKIIEVDGLTEGAACTTLLAKEYINTDDPLVIANSDQYLEWNSNEFMYSMTSDEIDGGILTFESNHPKWSYAKLDDKGYVSEVAEKKVISNLATTGIYYWKKGSDYIKYAEAMIEQNIRFNNEFYVCPVFNEAIKDGKKIKTRQVNTMWGIGTPEDLDYFLKNYIKK
jgi:beta-phosphoglucomutase-like phosphatase (HAD superfamily)/dTDP-glucose pyrophosphorylase